MNRFQLLVILTAAFAGACTGGSVPGEPTSSDALARGDALYAQSRYEEAERAYSSHLSTRPDDPRNDRVLLRQALIFLVYGAPERDEERGEGSLRELATRFPASPLREAADYVLALRSEVRSLRGDSARSAQRARRLEEQMEALKRIDLERSETPR